MSAIWKIGWSRPTVTSVFNPPATRILVDISREFRAKDIPEEGYITGGWARCEDAYYQKAGAYNGRPLYVAKETVEWKEPPVTFSVPDVVSTIRMRQPASATRKLNRAATRQLAPRPWWKRWLKAI